MSESKISGAGPYNGSPEHRDSPHDVHGSHEQPILYDLGLRPDGRSSEKTGHKTGASQAMTYDMTSEVPHTREYSELAEERKNLMIRHREILKCRSQLNTIRDKCHQCREAVQELEITLLNTYLYLGKDYFSTREQWKEWDVERRGLESEIDVAVSR